MHDVGSHGEEASAKKPKKKRFKKVLIAIGVILFIVVFVFLAGTPSMIMGDMVNMHVDFDEVYSAEDFGMTSSKVMLTTEDGLKVAAYEVTTKQPKAMVIFLSGIHKPSVTSFFGHAKMLKKNGYGSILLEMRAHGESEGDVIGLGYKEHLDVKAAVDYISGKYKNMPIIIYGLSMGATTAINATGEIEEIDGLISMSAYASLEDQFYDNMINMGAPKVYAVIQKPFVKVYATLKYGMGSFNRIPKEEIKKLGERPALIIHSTQDSQVPFASYGRIIKNAPKHVQTWVREGDYHFILKDEEDFLNPDKDEVYAAQILTFLNKHFGQ